MESTGNTNVLGKKAFSHCFPVWFVWVDPSSRAGIWPSPNNYNFLVILYWKQLRSPVSINHRTFVAKEKRFFVWDNELVQSKPGASSGHLCHQEGKWDWNKHRGKQDWKVAAQTAPCETLSLATPEAWSLFLLLFFFFNWLVIFLLLAINVSWPIPKQYPHR